MFYPEAMAKARLRVASVKIKPSANMFNVLTIQLEANAYAAAMPVWDVIPEDDGRLTFIYETRFTDFAPIMTHQARMH